jgi:hypothetical protein
MSENETNERRNFLRLLGLTAGAALVSTNAFSIFMKPEEILKLKPEQQEFMKRYGKWMDEFIEVIRIKKHDPLHKDNLDKMNELANRAEAFKPELTEHLKDKTFSIIYLASIERMSIEIKEEEHRI